MRNELRTSELLNHDELVSSKRHSKWWNDFDKKQCISQVNPTGESWDTFPHKRESKLPVSPLKQR